MFFLYQNVTSDKTGGKIQSKSELLVVKQSDTLPITHFSQWLYGEVLIQLYACSLAQPT